MNTDGGYDCTCTTGYTGSGQECNGKQSSEISFIDDAHSVRSGI